MEAQSRGINRSGNMAGFGRLGPGHPEQCEKRAHFWASPSATFVNLGAVMPTTEQMDNPSHAEALNDPSSGPVQAVGWDEEIGTAILWINEGESFGEEDWEAYDLHSLIVGSHPETVPQAHDINDQGWIIVYALLENHPEEDDHFAWLLIPTECPGDIDENGSVGFSDVLAVLNAWEDECEPGVMCPIDLDGDGLVGFGDLLIVLNAWGPCPGVGGSADDCADRDLGPNCECRDTLTDLIENGTAQESENARCWLDHYIACHDAQGCNSPPDCPDDDPCGKH